jgi:hypothetical protein
MKRLFTNEELETNVENFSDSKKKLGIKNVTEYMRWLYESSDHQNYVFWKNNRDTIQNQMERAKGLEVKFTNPELFWIEDILDSHLYRSQNHVRRAMKESKLDLAESEIQHGRLLMSLCKKVFLMLQYSNFKKDEKKYKNIRRREHSYRLAKDEPYYVPHARKDFNKAIKEIKRRRKLNLRVA